MKLALREARGAAECGEVPVGAVVVRNATTDCENSNQVTFEVLSHGSNRVESDMDASAHAELIALRQAAASTQNWRLLDSILYTTLEPCPMCLSAAQAFRLKAIVYGAPDLRLGAVCTHMNLMQVVPHPFHNISFVQGGVLQDECAAVMRDFFRQRRAQSKTIRAAGTATTKDSLQSDTRNRVQTTLLSLLNVPKAIFSWVLKVWSNTLSSFGKHNPE